MLQPTRPKLCDRKQHNWRTGTEFWRYLADAQTLSIVAKYRHGSAVDVATRHFHASGHRKEQAV